jgi:hypothetical protein
VAGIVERRPVAKQETLMAGPFATRDTLKPPAYWDAQVRYNETSLGEFRAIIASADTAPEHREQLRHTVFRRELEQLIVRYSSGEPVPALRAAYPGVVTALADYQQEAGPAAHNFEQFDAYVYALWIVSLGILLDVDDAEFRRAVRELDNQGRDAMFDRLVALRVERQPQADRLMYPEPYRPLYDALDASGQAQTRLVLEFLDGWYGGMQAAYWHGSHRGADAGYFGYWCFELAALVKGLAIDDSAFADNIYYPRDFLTSAARR